MDTISEMGEAALALAGKGFHVLPCWATNNTARPNRAKSPIGRLVPNGFKQATTDPAVIERWWTAQPDAMIGAVVDPRIAIVDVDPRNGGSVAAIEDLADCTITRTCTVFSGRGDGGRHLYYWRPDALLTARRLPVGVDLKTSGYCIVPPSIHPASGLPYRWDEQPIAELPRGLLELLTAAPARPAMRHHFRRPGNGPAALVAFVGRQPWGNVNNGLNWAAWQAVENGWLTSTLGDALVAAAIRAGESDRRARRTLESVEDAATLAGMTG